MKAEIVEVFRSFQGEGPYAGVPQVFVRFFGCNMHCVWCDTPASIGDGQRVYRSLSLEELRSSIESFPQGIHSVSITGGEPLMQSDFLLLLCRVLRDGGQKIYLDTNGTLPEALASVIEWIDIVAMDVKLPSSTHQRAFWDEHKAFLKTASLKQVFVKVVVSLATDIEDVLKAAAMVASVDGNILFILQPNHLEIKKGIVERCVTYQPLCARLLRDVRIIPQIHKFMKLR